MIPIPPKMSSMVQWRGDTRRGEAGLRRWLPKTDGFAEKLAPRHRRPEIKPIAALMYGLMLSMEWHRFQVVSLSTRAFASVRSRVVHDDDFMRSSLVRKFEVDIAFVAAEAGHISARSAGDLENTRAAFAHVRAVDVPNPAAVTRCADIDRSAKGNCVGVEGHRRPPLIVLRFRRDETDRDHHLDCASNPPR